MSGFSAFNSLNGGFRFTGKPSHSRNIYDSLIRELGRPGETYSTEEGTRMRAWCFATARQHARARCALEAGFNQIIPLRTGDNFLATREQEYDIIPAPTDSPDDRRRAIAAARNLPNQGTFNEIRNGLATLLGADFVAYISTPYADAEVDPPNCGDQPMSFVDVERRLPRLITLSQPVTMGLGTAQWVQYQDVALPTIPPEFGKTLPVDKLLVGENVVVDAGHNVLNERCVVEDLVDVFGSKAIKLNFTKPHAMGAPALSWTYPYWRSTKRFSLIVVADRVMLNAPLVRKIHRYMARVARSVSTWAICIGDPLNPRHTGNFHAGVSRAGVNTVGDVEWTIQNEVSGV